MRTLIAIWIFHKKIVIPSVAVAVLLGFMGAVSFNLPFHKAAGLSYVFILPLFHYIVYESRNQNEYYFYYNIGLNKTALWISTIIIGSLIGIIMILI